MEYNIILSHHNLCYTVFRRAHLPQDLWQSCVNLSEQANAKFLPFYSVITRIIFWENIGYDLLQVSIG
jgi:hypothetical protein